MDVIRRNLDWLHHWLPAAVGPLIAEPANRIVTETIEACRDAIRDRDTTTDLLLEAGRTTD